MGQKNDFHGSLGAVSDDESSGDDNSPAGNVRLGQQQVPTQQVPEQKQVATQQVPEQKQAPPQQQHDPFESQEEGSQMEFDGDPNQVLREGYVEKLSHGMFGASWAKRYMVLDSLSLKYYKKKGDAKALFDCPMTEITAILDQRKKESPQEFHLELKPGFKGYKGKQVLKLKCPSSREFQDWFEDIDAVLEVYLSM